VKVGTQKIATLLCESGYTKNSDLTMYLLLPILNSGINQLILMQGEIRQDVSGAFMQEFYHAWQKGISFEPAIQSARQKIYHDYSKVQWSIPVVYFVSSRKHLKDNESKLESISNLIRKENILLIIYSVLALLWAGGLSIASGPSYREIFFPPSLAILITNSWKIGLLLILPSFGLLLILPSLSSWMMTNKQKAIELIIKNAGFKKWEVTSIKFAHALLLNTIIWYLIWATLVFNLGNNVACRCSWNYSISIKFLPTYYLYNANNLFRFRRLHRRIYWVAKLRTG